MNYTRDELLSLDDDTILSLKNRNVIIQTCDEKSVFGLITGFKRAANSPNLVCSLIINENMIISFEKIKKITIQ
jgi:hypothetical protein